MSTTQAEPVIYAFQTESGGWRVAGSRVSMDSIIHAYWQGQTPETIVQEFPSLTHEQVYGAIAFYLRNRVMFDEYLRQQDELWERLRQEAAVRNKGLRERLLQRIAEREAGGATE